MNLQRYKDYFKDNPEGLWFKRKLYGWGWVPVKWQGWLVILLFVLFLVWSAVGLGPKNTRTESEPTLFVIKIILAVIVLIWICYKKGEKSLRWQWGPPLSIFERVKKFDLPLGEYAVFGSSLLDVWGIRRANDLDIIVTPELFEKLKKDDTWKDDSGPGYQLLKKGEADVTTVQDKPTVGKGNYCPDRLQLIKDAVIIHGVPFVRIEEVLACKTDYDREKDHVDIAAIKEYIEKHKGEDLYDL